MKPTKISLTHAILNRRVDVYPAHIVMKMMSEVKDPATLEKIVASHVMVLGQALPVKETLDEIDALINRAYEEKAEAFASKTEADASRKET
jgi:uncharacterized membrane-anchored protein YjiN (DUF445 family)